jgi:hypothetical protein
MQFLARNPPAIRKETKKGVQLIAVRIDNNSNHYIQLNESRFSVSTSSGRSIAILSPEQYFKATRQQPETFIFFYSIAGIGYFEEETTSYPSGNTTTRGRITYSPLPPAIGILNAIVAGSANSRERANLENNQIFERPIPPNTSLYGLLAISNHQYSELVFQYDSE